jgi:hypothetical protein
MWLSKQAAGGAAEGAHAAVGTVTLGGRDAAVLLSGEQRDLGVISPQGLQWTPKRDRQALVLQTDDGERYLLGVVAQAGDAPEAGTLRLSSGEVRLEITADGICLQGDVYLSGRLFLNGVELQAPQQPESDSEG